MGKKYDLAVKTGEYTDSQGNTKGRWLNVGSVMDGQDGGQFIILDRTFNPAGLPNPDNRTSILISMFEPKDGNGGGGQQQRTQQQSAPVQEQRAPSAAAQFDDDIPF